MIRTVTSLLIGVALLWTGTAQGRSAEDAARVEKVTAPATDFGRAERYETNAGGSATSTAPLNASAFSHPSANMSFERQLDFRVGDGIFRKLWVSAPSSTTS